MLAYSHCIAHGIEKDGMPLRNGMDQQYRAVATGYWPLVRYDLVLRDAGRNPFLLDSHRPRLPLSDYTGRELRYRILARTNPEAAERLSKLAEQQVSQRWATYEEMAARSPEWFTGQRRRRPGQHRERGEQPMNLSSSYLGLDLRNPLVASAGPMTQTADRIERLAEVGTDSFGEATSYLIDRDASLWPRQYLDLVQRAAKPGIPVIASLNGSTPGGWTGYARAMQDAGAAAIELNIYYLPGDPPPGSASPFASGSDAEQRYVDILTAVKSVVSVPVAVKLAPYFSSLGDMALRLERAA